MSKEHWFYNADFSVNNPTLSKDDLHHARKVLRLKEGESIGVTNGQGLVAECVFGDSLEIVSSEVVAQRLPEIHLAVSPTKSNDRTEWVIEKAIEIGVSEISFILTAHSERRKINLERFNRVAVAALKQSQGAWMPKLNELTAFGDWAKATNCAQKRIAYCGDVEKKSLKSVTPSQSICLVIGPEGDFSANEVEIAMENGFVPTTLGASRLRTETAAIVAVTLLNNL